MRSLILLAIGASIAAGPAAAQAGPADAVARGVKTAQRCAMCHAVGPSGRSPSWFAPTFAGLASRKNAAELRQNLQHIASKGHHGLRPRQISQAEAADVAAYIASLKRPSRR